MTDMADKQQVMYCSLHPWSTTRYPFDRETT